MGIEVASSFTRKAAVPIDDLSVVADITARDAIASGVRFRGMVVHVLSDNKNYQLNGGITNSDWKPYGSGGGGGSGGGATTEWVQGQNSGTLVNYDFNTKAFLFDPNIVQYLFRDILVPSSYLPGSLIKMRIKCFSLNSAMNVKFSLTRYLVDSSVAFDSYSSVSFSSLQQTMPVTIKSISTFEFNLTDVNGQINGVPVQPQNIIRLEFIRALSSSNDDSGSIYMLPNLTEDIYA